MNPDYPADTLQAMALWLARRMDRVRQHPAAADIVAEITAAVRAATRAIDLPPGRVYAGPCDCGTHLYGHPGRQLVSCPACGTTYGIAQRQEWMRSRLADQLVGAYEASLMLSGIGIYVADGTIRVWAQRRKLERRPSAAADPRYRFGDIVDLALARDTRAGLRVSGLRTRPLLRNDAVDSQEPGPVCRAFRMFTAAAVPRVQGQAHGRNPHAMHRTRMILASLAGLAAAVAIAAPAAAAPPPTPPRLATAACQITTPTCNEPVVAIAQTSGNDFTPADDAALSLFPHSQVFTRPNNSVDNGTQDWTANIDGFVPFHGAGDYHFTAFDRFNWSGRPFISEEWTPFGQSTGLCLNLRASDKRGVLSPCDGRAGEEFIISSHVPTVFPPASPAYRFAISVRHSLNTAHHLLLTADDTGLGQVHGGNPVHHSPGTATQQMWSALP